MTLLACLEAAALVLVVYLAFRHVARAEQAWTVERRELLTRIQRPEYAPTTNGEPFVVPEDEPDELHLVGQIQDLEPED